MIPEVSVANLLLPSVVGASTANTHGRSNRFPSADMAGVLDRNEAVRRTRLVTRLIGNRLPAWGHR